MPFFLLFFYICEKRRLHSPDSNTGSDEKKLSVLFLNSWYPNRTNDTLGNFVEKHIASVAPQVQAFSASVFSDASCKTPQFYVDSKKTFEELIVYYPKSPGIPLLKQIISLINFFRANLMIWKYLRKKGVQIDIVHVNVAFPIGFFALYLKKKYRIPFVVTEHSTIYSKKEAHLPAFQKWLAKKVFKNASSILPVSKNLQTALEALGVQGPFEVIPNVVDTNLFGLKKKSREERINFIHISTANDEQKNLSGIIRVFKEVLSEKPKVYLTILSDGNLLPYQNLANSLNISPEQLKFIGKSTTDEVAFHLQQQHALVLFSNYENFPCVIPEAFSVGIPVISTSVNGIPEYVNESNGILVHPGNEEELRTAILKFIEDGEKYDAEKLRAYAQNEFSYAAIGSKLLMVYKKVLHVP